MSIDPRANLMVAGGQRQDAKDGVAGGAARPDESAPPDAPRAPAPVEIHSLPLTVMTCLAVVFALDWAQAVFIPLLAGVIISYALSPLLNQLHKWHVPRSLGAALLLIWLVGVAAALVYSLHDQSARMIDSLPQAAQKVSQALRGEWGGPGHAIANIQKAASQIERAANSTGATNSRPAQGVTRVEIEQARFDIRDYLWNGTLGALSFVSLAAMVLFLAYFLLVSGDTFKRKLVALSGPTLSKKKITVQMLNAIGTQIQRYLLVLFGTSVLVGVATWLALLAIGLERAAVWGVAAAVFNIVPYLGAILIGAGTALVAFLQFGSVSMAATAIGITLLIHVLVGNLLTPWLTGRASRMNAVVVFVSVLFWGWLWGAWGLLLGMPIMMAIKSVCDHVEGFKPVAELLAD